MQYLCGAALPGQTLIAERAQARADDHWLF